MRPSASSLRRFGDLGVEGSDLPRLAEAVMEVTKLPNRNPKIVEPEDALKICEKAYESVIPAGPGCETR